MVNDRVKPRSAKIMPQDWGAITMPYFHPRAQFPAPHDLI
jgi:hypothetical protein